MKLSIDLNQFREAMKEHSEQITEATRPAAQAGAQVIYDQARANIHNSDAAHFFYSRRGKNGKAGQKYLFYPGDLKKSIYQVYAKRKSTDTVATYEISYNVQKAPYAHMVEYGTVTEFGTIRMPANPFLHNALVAKEQEAIDAIESTFIEKAGL